MTDKPDSLDSLAAKLRHREPEIPDGGFSTAVMLQLTQSRGLPLWLKNLILLVATALGAGLAAAQASTFLTTAVLAAMSANLPLMLGTAIASACGVALISCWVADG